MMNTETDSTIPLEPQPRHAPGRATSDRIAIADGDLGRIRNTLARMALIRERARGHFRDQRDQLELERRGPGVTWRGWWYPRGLLQALAWLAAAVLFGALCVGLFSHPILGA